MLQLPTLPVVTHFFFFAEFGGQITVKRPKLTWEFQKNPKQPGATLATPMFLLFYFPGQLI
jgi:hypothetical protein